MMKQREQNDDGQRHTQKPKQNSTSHGLLLIGLRDLSTDTTSPAVPGSIA
jgi:hypothetical protein